METRQIELSLDTAKRLYEQGGEYRDIALTAFKEHELIGDGLPKTWEEYCAKHGEVGDKIKASLDSAYTVINKYIFSDYKQAQAYIAMIKLYLLRDEYRQGWKPDWSDNCYKYGVKWNIFPRKKELIVTWRNYDPLFLSLSENCPSFPLASPIINDFCLI